MTTANELLMSCPDDQVARMGLVWKAAAAGEWKDAAHHLRAAAAEGESSWHDRADDLADEYESRVQSTIVDGVQASTDDPVSDASDIITISITVKVYEPASVRRAAALKAADDEDQDAGSLLDPQLTSVAECLQYLLDPGSLGDMGAEILHSSAGN